VIAIRWAKHVELYANVLIARIWWIGKFQLSQLQIDFANVQNRDAKKNIVNVCKGETRVVVNVNAKIVKTLPALFPNDNFDIDFLLHFKLDFRLPSLSILSKYPAL
jgi:hypothetical protein